MLCISRDCCHREIKITLKCYIYEAAALRSILFCIKSTLLEGSRDYMQCWSGLLHMEKLPHLTSLVLTTKENDRCRSGSLMYLFNSNQDKNMNCFTKHFFPGKVCQILGGGLENSPIMPVKHPFRQKQRSCNDMKAI